MQCRKSTDFMNFFFFFWATQTLRRECLALILFVVICFVKWLNTHGIKHTHAQAVFCFLHSSLVSNFFSALASHFQERSISFLCHITPLASPWCSSSWSRALARCDVLNAHSAWLITPKLLTGVEALPFSHQICNSRLPSSHFWFVKSHLQLINTCWNGKKEFKKRWDQHNQQRTHWL